MIEEIKKISFLLTAQEKKSLLFLSILLLIGMILEVIGLGAILPIIAFVLDSEMLLGNELINKYFGNFIIKYDYNTIAIFMLGGLVLLYIIKTVFLGFLTYKQSLILEKIHGSLSVSLFKGYLFQPYKYHIKRDLSLKNHNRQ